MQGKTITYKRIVNLGNYEAKHLEETWELDPTDDLEAETSRLMEFVERKIKEEAQREIKAELAKLRQHRRELRKQIAELERKLGQLQQGAAANSAELEPDPEDIPFETGDTPVDSGGVPDGF